VEEIAPVVEENACFTNYIYMEYGVSLLFLSPYNPHRFDKKYDLAIKWCVL
jgi:hypothetical protein